MPVCGTVEENSVEELKITIEDLDFSLISYR